MNHISNYTSEILADIAGQPANRKEIDNQAEALYRLIHNARTSQEQAYRVKMMFRLAQRGFDLHTCIKFINDRFSQPDPKD